MKESTSFWDRWDLFYQDWGYTLETGVVVVFWVAIVLLLLWARKQPHWVNAWNQLKGKRLSMLALAVILLYATVATLDSIAWRNVALNKDKQPILDDKGAVVLEVQGLTLLDRLLTDMRENTEQTFSAPLSDKLFVKMAMEGEDGTITRDHPKLKHKGSHILGTDQTGRDVFFAALKGVRTAMILGFFTTLLAVPFAILFGVLAGFFGGRVDDAIQYIYTTIACVPGVLLIIAFMMIVGQRSLTMLCIAMGITSWTGLCRVIRGETLKLREQDYVQAAEALGVNRFVVLFRHILPNLFHIILISSVMRFSGLVMSETMLAYIGVGVGPDTGSWGNMITAARFELGRDPVIYWNLIGAAAFMFALVLSVNLFGDSLRDALDPKLRTR